MLSILISFIKMIEIDDIQNQYQQYAMEIIFQ